MHANHTTTWHGLQEMRHVLTLSRKRIDMIANCKGHGLQDVRQILTVRRKRIGHNYRLLTQNKSQLSIAHFFRLTRDLDPLLANTFHASLHQIHKQLTFCCYAQSRTPNIHLASLTIEHKSDFICSSHYNICSRTQLTK